MHDGAGNRFSKGEYAWELGDWGQAHGGLSNAHSGFPEMLKDMRGRSKVGD